MEVDFTTTETAISEPTKIHPCDGVFATVVLAPTRILASFYWATYPHYGKPLVLCDFEVAPIDGSSWEHIATQLQLWHVMRRSRLPKPLGLFVEGEFIAAQAQATGVDAKFIPAWLTAKDNWYQIVQSAAAILARSEVGYTAQAAAHMARRPFLDDAAVTAGPRPEDPAIVAFLYGVVIALDPIASRDPHPKKPTPSSRR